MSHLPIIIVNEQDEPIGSASIPEARAKGLSHRIARVMVEDLNGNVLLQRRAQSRELYPGRWDNSAAGHVDKGESYLAAALRELAEEIGLEGVALQEIGYYRHSGKFKKLQLERFTKVYRVVVPGTVQFTIQAEEVSAVRWFGVAEVKQLIANDPEQVTDGVVDVIKRYYL